MRVPIAETDREAAGMDTIETCGPCGKCGHDADEHALGRFECWHLGWPNTCACEEFEQSSKSDWEE